MPMYFIIGIWGGERRIYAAIKFFLYTMVGSLLMLVAILYLGVKACDRDGTSSNFDLRHLMRIAACARRAAVALRRVLRSRSR